MPDVRPSEHMNSRLHFALTPGWVPAPDAGPDDPPAFLRETSATPGLLQVHTRAFYRRGPKPNVTPQHLVALATHAAESTGVNIASSATGTCQMGSYASVVGAAPGFPRVQLWALSNGQDIVVLSHSCPSEPDTAEVLEAQSLVSTISVRPEPKPWWHFW